MVSKTVETLEAREISAIDIDSVTKNFLSAKAFSTAAKNLLTYSINLPISIFIPCLWARTALAAG